MRDDFCAKAGNFFGKFSKLTFGAKPFRRPPGSTGPGALGAPGALHLGQVGGRARSARGGGAGAGADTPADTVRAVAAVSAPPGRHQRGAEVAVGVCQQTLAIRNSAENDFFLFVRLIYF